MAPYRKNKQNYLVMRVGGNYIGPGWSDGKFQDSVAYGKSKPTSKLDVAAYHHDTAYARGENLDRADQVFVQAASRSGHPRGIPSALAVAAQRYFRKDRSSPYGFSRKSKIFPENANDYHPTSFPEKDMVARSNRMSSRWRVSALRKTLNPEIRKGYRTPSPPLPKVKSPGHTKAKKSGNVRKSRRMAGATSSKSSGFLPRRGRRVYGKADKFLTKGIVYCRESSGNVSTTALESAQSVMVGHSSLSKTQLCRDISLAFTKWLATVIYKTQILDFTDLCHANVNARHSLYVLYKTHAGAVDSFQTIDITITTTWDQVATWFVTVMSQANGQSGFKFVRLENYHQVYVDGAWTSINTIKYDLTRMNFDVYSKSALKIQNRTINVAGNTDDDDVDNVPLYGKFYSGSGNYVQVSDTVIGTGAFGDAHTVAPYVTRKFTSSYLPQMREPQPLSVVKRATGIGKVHLDPGQIKTSVLNYRKRLGLNYLATLLARTGGDLTASTSQILSLGKFKFFQLEKMIQAVATTDVNAINIAYEVDFKCGAICSAPRIQHTNMIIAIQNP